VDGGTEVDGGTDVVGLSVTVTVVVGGMTVTVGAGRVVVIVRVDVDVRVRTRWVSDCDERLLVERGAIRAARTGSNWRRTSMVVRGAGRSSGAGDVDSTVAGASGSAEAIDGSTGRRPAMSSGAA
jgi:hypothetical protein